MMNNLLKISLLLTCIVGIFFLIGCSSSKQVSPLSQSKSTITQREREIRHDRALQHFIEGAALDAKNAYAEAILEYQEALQADPNASIFSAISKDYSLLGKHARAAETAREAVRLEPENIVYRENLAAIYLNAYQQDLAISEYEKILKIDSNYTTGWFNLAHLYQPTRPLKALEIYEKLLNREDDQWDILFQCATLYLSLGKFDSAAIKYKMMLELDPSNRPLQKQLAETYAKGGKLNEAQTILESMIERDSSDAEVVAALADLYLDQKQFKKAIELYGKLLSQGTKSPEIKLRIGIGFFGMTERDSTLIPKARILFEEVAKELPNDWRSYWYLGAIAANERKDSLASSYFERVTKLAEWNGDAWWFFGSSLFEQGKYDKLLEMTERAQKAVPKDFRIYLLQGLAYTRLEQQEDAVKALEKAYGLNPKDLNTLSDTCFNVRWTAPLSGL